MKDEMNEFESVESLLRSMPLRQPSRELDGRVAATIRPVRRFPWVWAAVAGTLAAAAAVVIVVQSQTTPVTPEKPVVAEARPAHSGELVQTDVQWTDDGIVGSHQDGPVRQYTVQSVSQIYCTTENGPAVMTIPEEQTVYVLSRAY